MDDVLLDIVLRRLDADPLPAQAEQLLLAALNADDTGDVGEKADAAPTSAGAYLRSLTVSGFRGIGPPATLEVAPRPGLTLVVGRNGSGKSSFAEALELLVTGAVLRWAKPAPAVVRDSWRSKHATAATEIQAEFLIEGVPRQTVVARVWPGEADLDGSEGWLQRHGDKRGAIEELGWADELREFRPFLSHAELEAFFGRPSELHDLLSSVLGLEELTSASERLNVDRKEREDALAAIKQRLAQLTSRLRELDDERAGVCLAALSGRSWDIAAAQAAATGMVSETDGGQLEPLRRLAQLHQPSAADATSTVAALRAAAAGLEAVAGTAAGRAMDLVGLLEAALQHQHAHGDGDCPVCGRPGALTPQWQATTQQHVSRLREEASTAKAARDVVATAVEQARALIQPMPAVLQMTVTPVLPDRGPARQAWTEWAERNADTGLLEPAGLRAMADHIELRLPPLADAVDSLIAQAAAELTKRDDRWAPLAADVASWCADAAPVREAAELVASIKKARTWLQNASAELRDERLAPLADQARAIWAMLRQESNVDLGLFRLAGTNTQRKLELDVSIDGSPGAALGVMSQGEINALALSVFLPRATMPKSPFRFLVIDDPVQAMDPAKVDGLARVLAQVAADRQVIVFTHDNRLGAAVKDLKIEATILEVTRRPQSLVQVRRRMDPAEQALRDAGALIRDQEVPAGVAMRVIPGLCRSAVEAVFIEAVWRRQLRAGSSRNEIEEALTGVRRLRSLAALALFDDVKREGDVTARLRQGQDRMLADTLSTLNAGSHESYAGDLEELVINSRKLVSKIREITQ
jgi:energy-coupling factor transporter ATP-binding protein EcfA2